MLKDINLVTQERVVLIEMNVRSLDFVKDRALTPKAPIDVAVRSLGTNSHRMDTVVKISTNVNMIG